MPSVRTPPPHTSSARLVRTPRPHAASARIFICFIPHLIDLRIAGVSVAASESSVAHDAFEMDVTGVETSPATGKRAPILGIFSTLIAARIIHIVSTVMQLHVTPAPCVAFYIQQKKGFFSRGEEAAARPGRSPFLYARGGYRRVFGTGANARLL